MLSEKKIACMYKGMIALRKLQTHRKRKRRLRKKVGADLGAGASEMPYIYRAQTLAQTKKDHAKKDEIIRMQHRKTIVKQLVLQWPLVNFVLQWPSDRADGFWLEFSHTRTPRCRIL